MIATCIQKSTKKQLKNKLKFFYDIHLFHFADVITLYHCYKKMSADIVPTTGTISGPRFIVGALNDPAIIRLSNDSFQQGLATRAVARQALPHDHDLSQLQIVATPTTKYRSEFNLGFNGNGRIRVIGTPQNLPATTQDLSHVPAEDMQELLNELLEDALEFPGISNTNDRRDGVNKNDPKDGVQLVIDGHITWVGHVKGEVNPFSRYRVVVNPQGTPVQGSNSVSKSTRFGLAPMDHRNTRRRFKAITVAYTKKSNSFDKDKPYDSTKALYDEVFNGDGLKYGRAHVRKKRIAIGAIRGLLGMYRRINFCYDQLHSKSPTTPFKDLDTNDQLATLLHLTDELMDDATFVTKHQAELKIENDLEQDGMKMFIDSFSECLERGFCTIIRQQPLQNDNDPRKGLDICINHLKGMN